MSKMRRKLSFGAGAAAAILLISSWTAPAALADTAPPDAPDGYGTSQQSMVDVPDPALDPAATSSLTQHEQDDILALVDASNSKTLSFDGAAAAVAGVDATAIADFGSMLEAQGWTVTGLDRGAASESTDAFALGAKACTGTRGYTGYWGWGWQWGINSCDTNLLISIFLNGGASYGAISGFILSIPGAAPAAAVTLATGGLIAAGAAPISICRDASYTKKAVFLNVAYTGTGCWGQ